MMQTYICLVCIFALTAYTLSSCQCRVSKANSQFGTAKTKAMGTGSSRWWVGRDEGVWGDGRGGCLRAAVALLVCC